MSLDFMLIGPYAKAILIIPISMAICSWNSRSWKWTRECWEVIQNTESKKRAKCREKAYFSDRETTRERQKKGDPSPPHAIWWWA